MNTLYVLVAGSRNVPADPDYDRPTYFKMIDDAIAEQNFEYDSVIEICGEALGGDAVGKEWANAHGYLVMGFPANWNRLGKSAGPVRNQDMVNYIKNKELRIAILFWDGQSRGTKHTLELCKQNNIPYKLYSL